MKEEGGENGKREQSPSSLYHPVPYMATMNYIIH